MWKWLLGIVIVLVVLGGGMAVIVVGTGALDTIRNGFGHESASTEVDIESVSRGNLVRTVNAPGTIEPEESVQVGAQVSARIIALPVEELDHVEEGDVLCRLDSEDVLARLEAARSRLQAEEAHLVGVQASLKLAEIDLGRQKELFDTGDVAESVYDAAEATFEQAKSGLEVTKMNIKALEAQIAESQKDLDNTVIEAPMSGTVTRVNVDAGEMVLGTSNNVGTVIMEIADLDRMIMRTRIDESNIALVREGQPATIYVLAFGERKFTGTVQRVRLFREFYQDGTAYVEAEILMDNPDGERLGIGWNANADIEVQTQYDVIKVPSQAVMDKRLDDIPDDVLAASPYIDRDKIFARVVYRVVDGKTVMTPVTIGSSDLTHTVVLAGLSEGDEIVTGPFRTLMDIKHDQAVRRAGATTEGAGAEVATPSDDAAGAQAGEPEREGEPAASGEPAAEGEPAAGGEPVGSGEPAESGAGHDGGDESQGGG